MSTPDRGELIVYRTEDGQAEVQLQTLDGSVWLNQGEMAELFDTTKQNVSLHIKNILKEGELAGGGNCQGILDSSKRGHYQQLKTSRYPSRAGYCHHFEVTPSSFKRDLEFPRYRLPALISCESVGWAPSP